MIAGNSQGPKRRYLQNPRCFPEAEEVLAHYSQRPEFGGFVAMNISLEDATEYRDENKTRRWDNELAAQRARGDVRSMTKLLTSVRVASAIALLVRRRDPEAQPFR